MSKNYWLAAAVLLAATLPAQAQTQTPAQDQPPQQTQQTQDSTAQMAAACKAIPPPQADGAVRPPPDFNSGYCWGAFTSNPPPPPGTSATTPCSAPACRPTPPACS